MTDIKIGYKVVRFLPMTGLLMSANVSYSQVEYKVGEWVNKPDCCGPLAVFNTAREADIFSWPEQKVYRCEYKESTDNALWNGQSCLPEISTPRGTRFAEAVKLIEEIESV